MTKTCNILHMETLWYLCFAKQGEGEPLYLPVRTNTIIHITKQHESMYLEELKRIAVLAWNWQENDVSWINKRGGCASSSDKENRYAKIHILRYRKDRSIKKILVLLIEKWNTNENLKIPIILHKEKVGILVQLEER